MTEEEWLKCEEPVPMLEFIREKASHRRFRLLSGQFCLHCFSAYPVTDDRDTTRQMAGEAIEHRRKPDWTVETTPPSDGLDLPEILLHTDAFTAANGVGKALGRLIRSAIFNRDMVRADFDVDKCFDEIEAATSALNQGLSVLIRDIFGNPFRPVHFSSEWRTDTAMSLARQMYESRDFSAAPILADALQDAGCDSDAILKHLRDPHATHVRGCWALDLVLGKE